LSEVIKREKLLEYLKEDLGFGDLTSDILLEDIVVKGLIVAKEDCVLAGLEEIRILLETLNCEFKALARDGDFVKSNTVVAEIIGKSKILLSSERTVLNILMRMSGVATLTKKIIDLAKEVNPKVKIAGTRKTLPGFRIFDKRAIEIAGGDTHRFRLDDCILIKDNHIKLVGLELAIRRAKERVSFTKKIEVEVNRREEAIKAAQLGADIIMLDNFKVEEIKKTVEELKILNLRDKVILEASGNINLDNIKAYAAAGVDVISLGLITHSAKAVDFSLEILG